MSHPFRFFWCYLFWVDSMFRTNPVDPRWDMDGYPIFVASVAPSRMLAGDHQDDMKNHVFRIGNPYKASFITVTGRGPHQTYTKEWQGQSEKCPCSFPKSSMSMIMWIYRSVSIRTSWHLLWREELLTPHVVDNASVHLSMIEVRLSATSRSEN